MDEKFDFSAIEKPVSTSYLKPGYYRVSVKEAKFMKPEGTKQDGSAKTPFIEVTFGAEEGIVKEKFFITPKALNRLQYLHVELSGKKLEKPLTAEQIGAYFEQMLNHAKVKSNERIIAVSGSQVNGNVYGSLGYTDFFMPEGMNPDLGPFEPGSAIYQRYVRVERNESHSTDDIIMQDNSSNEDDDDSSDLPF